MPLTYLALKVVLEHLEVNRRLTLAIRCQQIRNLHQQIPLVIDHLKIRENCFTLNGVDHLFLTTLVHPSGGPVPRDLRENSLFGGLEYDVDEFGEPEKLYLGQRAGDLKIRKNWEQPEVQDENRFQIKNLPIARRSLDQNEYPALGNPVSQRQKFNFYIRYVCRKPFRTCLLEPVKLPAGLKIRDALRQLFGVLLNEKTTIRHMEIDIANGIARLPAGLRINVHTLSFMSGCPEVCEALNRLSKNPLRNLNIGLNRSPVPKSSDEGPLLVRMDLKPTQMWYKFFACLSNETIHFTKPACFWSCYEFYGMLEEWVKKPRQIGARISFQIRGVKDFLDLVVMDYEDIVKGVLRRNRCAKFPFCATVPMDEGSKRLNIYGDKCPDEFIGDNGNAPFMIVFEVMEPGSAMVAME